MPSTAVIFRTVPDGTLLSIVSVVVIDVNDWLVIVAVTPSEGLTLTVVLSTVAPSSKAPVSVSVVVPPGRDVRSRHRVQHRSSINRCRPTGARSYRNRRPKHKKRTVVLPWPIEAGAVRRRFNVGVSVRGDAKMYGER